MNTVSRVVRNALHMAEPDMTVSLKGLLDDFIPATGEYFVTRERDKAEAQALLPQLQQLCAPANQDVVAAWLSPLAGSVKNPPSDDDLAARVLLVCAVMADLPIGVWTSETQGRAIRTFKFWPSVAELDELLRPVGERLRRQFRNASRVAEGTVMPQIRPVTPEQERAYITELVARQQEHREMGAAAPRRWQAQHDEPLETPSREVLIERYEAMLLRADRTGDSRSADQCREMLTRLRAPLPSPAYAPNPAAGKDSTTRLSAVSLAGKSATSPAPDTLVSKAEEPPS